MTAEITETGAPWCLEGAVGYGDISERLRLDLKPDGLPSAAARIFKKNGITCIKRTASADAALRRTGEVIAGVPGLWPIVDRRVDRIAIVGGVEGCFDISHSDPAWPGIVLVSVPPPSAVSDLRLAEGVIHEAMHHHLSALEDSVLLVREECLLYSPWRNTNRPASGVLHGLFVFACVADAFQKLIGLGGLSEEGLRHAKRRIDDIRGNFEGVDHQGLCAVLTGRGRAIHLATRRALERPAPP